MQGAAPEFQTLSHSTQGWAGADEGCVTWIGDWKLNDMRCENAGRSWYIVWTWDWSNLLTHFFGASQNPSYKHQLVLWTSRAPFCLPNAAPGRGWKLVSGCPQTSSSDGGLEGLVQCWLGRCQEMRGSVIFWEAPRKPTELTLNGKLP